jgi:hypothetical protein
MVSSSEKAGISKMADGCARESGHSHPPSAATGTYEGDLPELSELAPRDPAGSTDTPSPSACLEHVTPPKGHRARTT